MRSNSVRFSLALAAAALAVLVFLPTGQTDASGINAALICEPGQSGAICEDAPFSTSYSYAWSASGNLTLSGGNFIKQVSCVGSGSGGTVTVTVTAPGIGSDTASRSVGCSGPGGGPPWDPPGGPF
ncbi:MAG: hypothetical protein AAFY88_29595 [Acidobacteriota bacterium]